jgi:hypothetical protein
MAKTAKKTSSRGGKPGVAAHAHDEEDLDHDHGVADGDATPDAALPEARGGVEVLKGKRQAPKRKSR